jgi:hypothetical protein
MHSRFLWLSSAIKPACAVLRHPYTSMVAGTCIARTQSLALRSQKKIQKNLTA